MSNLTEYGSAYKDLLYPKLRYIINKPATTIKGPLQNIAPRWDNAVTVLIPSNGDEYKPPVKEIVTITIHLKQGESAYYSQLKSHNKFIYKTQLTSFNKEFLRDDNNICSIKPLILTNKGASIDWAAQAFSTYEEINTRTLELSKEFLSEPGQVINYLSYMIINYYPEVDPDEFKEHIAENLSEFSYNRYLADNISIDNSEELKEDIKKYIKYFINGK